MDLNIINLDNSSNNFNNFSYETNSCRLNRIFKNIFKFSAFFLGILVTALITFDLSEKIIRTYSDIDSFENLRKLEEALAVSGAFESRRANIEETSRHIDRVLDAEPNSIEKSEIIAIFEEENKKIQAMLNEALGALPAKEVIHLRDENQQAINMFYKRVNSTTYKGVWQSNEASNYLENKLEGEIALKIERFLNQALSTERMLVTFRLLDGSVIDKWIIVKSLNFPFTNITLTNTTLTQSYLSIVEFGEIFETNDLVLNCKSEFHFDWSEDTSQDKEIIESFKGSFKSNCNGMNDVTFIMTIEEEDEDYYNVLIYSIIVCVFALTQIFNTLWLNKQINTSITSANTISLATIVQNTVWNAYGCLCHFFLTVSYDAYKLQFGLPAFIYFFNFSIFEIRLLTNIFNIKNVRLYADPHLLRKKLVQFYFMFYLVMFFSLFYVMKFFFEKPYILIAISATWIPQIVYNIIYNNRMSMPLINIVLLSLNKLFLPFYFRGYNDNLFKLSTDLRFLMIGLLVMIVEIALLYSQTVLGPRWFIPYNFNKDGFNFFKTREEIIAVKPDAEYLDCIICLFSLFNPEQYRHFSDDFIASADPNRFCCLKSGKVIWRKIVDFHEYDYNMNKKPFMMTPCRHIFHSACLESWFKQKKECPSCRQDIG